MIQIHLFRVVGDVKVRIDKENVFGFQVRVGQLVVVKESHGVRQLIANVSDLVQRVRLVIVVLLLFIGQNGRNFI
jgi:hypothetical protein